MCRVNTVTIVSYVWAMLLQLFKMYGQNICFHSLHMFTNTNVFLNVPCVGSTLLPLFHMYGQCCYNCSKCMGKIYVSIRYTCLLTQYYSVIIIWNSNTEYNSTANLWQWINITTMSKQPVRRWANVIEHHVPNTLSWMIFEDKESTPVLTCTNKTQCRKYIYLWLEITHDFQQKK